jgi:hypothetical protein
MKLMLGRPDDTEITLAEQVNGTWQPSPKLVSDLTSFLQGADPEEFELWVEEDD